MHLIVNKNSNIYASTDMFGGKYTVCMPKSSGSSVSWVFLASQNLGHETINVEYTNTYAECLDKVAKDPKMVMFLVSGSNSPILKKADKMDKFRLASVYGQNPESKVDAKGNKIYTLYTIPKSTYPNMQYRWYWNRSIDTIGVDAVLVLKTDWVKKYGQEAFDSLTLSVLETKTEISRQVNKH
jgi:TRAP-type uncharacterized transport system substrate-binding protein